MMSNAELMDRGIMCLLNVLGSVDTERFISNILREKSDYTKWQQQRFDNVSSDDFYYRKPAVHYIGVYMCISISEKENRRSI